MSFLNQMYRKTSPNEGTSNKNPNRVSGGLRAQGVDHVIFVSENGEENSVATKRYVDSLETRIRQQHTRLTVLEKSYQKVNRELRSSSSNSQKKGDI